MIIIILKCSITRPRLTRPRSNSVMAFLLSISLIIQPLLPLAAELSIDSKLDDFSVDLGATKLTMQDIHSKVKLIPAKNGEVIMSIYHAKKLMITMQKAPEETADTPETIVRRLLPDVIKIPVAFDLQQGQIEVIEIHRGDKIDVLYDVQFQLTANQTDLKLSLNIANSPWGTLHARLDIENKNPFPLTGRLQLTHLTEKNVPVEMPYDVDATLSGSLKNIQFDLKTQLQTRLSAENKTQFSLLSSDDQSVKNVLLFTGHLQLEDNYPLNMQLLAQQMQLNDFYAGMNGTINLKMSTDTFLTKNAPINLQLNAENSVINNQALALNATAKVENNQLKQLNIVGNVAKNHFSAFGHLLDNTIEPDAIDSQSSHQTDNTAAISGIQWQLDIVDLNMLGNEFTGALRASGLIKKDADGYLFNYLLAANNVQLPQQTRLEKLDAQGAFSSHKNGVFNSTISLQNASFPSEEGAEINSFDASIQLSGQYDAHQLQVQLKNLDQNTSLVGLKLMVNGGFQTQGWQGHITQLSSLDNKTIQLRQPAPVVYSAKNGASIKAFTLNFNPPSNADDAMKSDKNSSSTIKPNDRGNDVISKGDISIDTLQFNLNESPAENSTITDNIRFQSIGRFNNIAFKTLQNYLLGLPKNLNNTLALNGNWDIKLNQAMNAEVNIWRSKGDFEYASAKQDLTNQNDENDQNHWFDQQQINPLDLENLQLNLKVVNNAFTLQGEMTTKSQGFIRGKLESKLSVTSQKIGFASNAPLTTAINADINTSVLMPMLSAILPDAAIPTTFESLETQGKLKLKLAGRGTVAQPLLAGTFKGEQLKLLIPNLGIAIQEGQFSSQFNHQSLTLSALEFKGNTGKINATAEAHFGVPADEAKAKRPNENPHQSALEAKIHLKTDNFSALTRIDRQLKISGDTDLIINHNQAIISGQLDVLGGLFELPKNDIPKLDQDVIIYDPVATEKNARLLAEEKNQANKQLAWRIQQLKVNFTGANPFIIRGSGIDGVLSGNLTLNGDPFSQLNAVGSLNVIGTYLAYGQVLNIETGQINFSGPMQNAGLNITATRDLTPTKPGVNITGTLATPKVKLISTPEVSDSDKLSLLIVGQTINDVGTSQLALISAAAGALLEQGESVPIQSRVASMAGLDSLSVTGSNNSNYAISLGKRLSSKLFLGYEKSIYGLLNVAKLTYQLTQRVSLQTRAGSESSVDLLYGFDFD